MRLLSNVILVVMLSTAGLVGCGGDAPGSSSNAGSTDGGDSTDNGGGDTTSISGVTYLPLSVLEASTKYSGAPEDNLFQGEHWLDQADTDAFIPAYLINPVDAATFSSVSTATASDYKLTVDGVDIDASESFPLLQKVIGTKTTLLTALVFDLSNSVDSANISALVTEAKAYVAAAQASSDKTIKNQYFVVWAFGQTTQDLTTGFTTDAVAINNALDQVVALYNSRTLGGGSNLHRAIIESIGRYQEDPYDFRDPDVGPYNDLVDYAFSAGIQLSQLVLFSSGPDTFLEFSQNDMKSAVQSQSFLKYDPANTADSAPAMINLYKPVFYYVIGGSSAGSAYSALSEVAESTTSLTLSSGAYNFHDDLIAKQQAAIAKRIDLSNQYVYRYAFVPRIGEHESIFASKSVGNNYSLTTAYSKDYVETNFGSVGTPEQVLTSLVEITGEHGEFISRARITLSEESKFAPATRWTTRTFTASNYSWAITNGSGTTNSDGTFTVTGVTGTATLTLTNTALSQSYSVTITN